MNDRTQQARDDLRTWNDNKPQNFFASDNNIQNVLHYYLGDDAYKQHFANFNTFGEVSASILNEAMHVEDRLHNHPQLERYSGVGERIEQIEFHKNHDLTGHYIWKAGMLSLQSEAGNNVQQMGLLYLMAHNGEGGHACSIACTAGLIRALQQKADEKLKAKYLPHLLDPDFSKMHHGAQFLTEIQGGSDVGANSLTATQQDDDIWLLNGEKWFCSNINADQFLVMARPEGAVDGTKGLGVFLVPRLLDDGTTNGFHIRRMKEKLGTRTMASVELDFIDAVAYPIGAIDEGFKTTVELVLNTSRLFNAISCAGIMRRAYIEAASYACYRQAFGNVIANYPLVQETVADILSETYAGTASSFAVAHLLDRIETGTGSEDDPAVYRILVNLNKYITSIRGSEAVHQAIEVLGGNGAIESFSVLPRLYRDMVVLESWEGTHNVLCLQVLRDINRYQLHKPFINFLRQRLTEISHSDLLDSKHLVEQNIAQIGSLIARMAENDAQYQQAHARRFADLASITAQAVLMLGEAQWELERGFTSIKPDVIRHFVNRRLVRNYDAMDDEEYLTRIERIMAAY